MTTPKRKTKKKVVKADYVLVFAGSFHQFLDLVRERKLKMDGAHWVDAEGKSYRYIDRPDQVWGLRNYEIKKVGTWYERKRVVDALNEAEYRLQAYGQK